MGAPDKSLQLGIDVSKTGDGDAQASAGLRRVKDDTAAYQAALEAMGTTLNGPVKDESDRYAEALQAMADRSEAAKDGTSELNTAVREYAEAVQAAKAEMEGGGGAFIPDNLADKLGEVGTALDDEGEKAGHAGPKHMMLRRMMGELDRISPGLGESLHLVADAYLAAGESGEAGAVGVKGFAAAMDSVLISLGPLLIAMLSIQAVMEYWDLYKEKVNAVAEAQAEAMKKIQESTRGALKAVQELEEAMHPKEHNTAEKDEKDLKNQQRELENNFNRQKELNKANEEKEMSGAGSKEEKEGIKQHYEMLDKQLDDWRAKQNAAIEGAMVGTMQAQLKQLQSEQDELEKKRAPLFQMAKERGDASILKPNDDALAKNAAEAKAIRDKLDDLTDTAGNDANDAGFKSETNRQAYGVKGQRYAAPNAGYNMPSADAGADEGANKFATGKSIADKAISGEKVSDGQRQFLVVLEQTLTGHQLTFEQAVALIQKQQSVSGRAVGMLEAALHSNAALDARLTALEAQHGNSRNTQGGQG